MTRKQALLKILEILHKQDLTSENSELIEKINELICDLPVTSWDKKTIFDTFDQFYIDNRRNATISDIKLKGLPAHSTIKHRFGMTAKEFLKKYYPPLYKCNAKGFEHKSREEWLEIFLLDYLRIKPTCAEEFNAKRSKNTPSWSTLAKLFSISLWSDFQKFNNLPVYRVKNKTKRKVIVYNFQRFSDVRDQLDKLDELDKLNGFNRLKFMASIIK